MKSPCRGCPGEFLDKHECIPKCERLREYQQAISDATEGWIRPAEINFDPLNRKKPVEKPYSKRVVTCIDCGRVKPDYGGGRCSTCYSRFYYRMRKKAEQTSGV